MYSWDWRQLAWLNYFGWWPSSTSKKYVHIYGYFTTLFTIFSLLSEIYGLYSLVTHQTFNAVIFNLTSIMRGCLGLFKIITILTYKKSIIEIVEDLNRLGEQVYLNGKPEQKSELQRRVQRCRISTFIIHYTVFALSLWILRCIIEAIFYGERTLVINSYSPFTLDNWSSWFVAVLWQTAYYIVVSCVFSIVDSLLGSIAELILCHFHILKMNLSDIAFGIKRTREDESNMKCSVIYHQKLLRICLTLKDVSLLVVFSHCSIATAIICLTLFEMSFLNTSGSSKMANAFTVYLMVVEIFIYCWYCNEITTQCKEVSSSAYLSTWYAGTKKEKKDLIILLARTEMSVVFGGIIRTDLDTFINILKGAFSYYSFLKVMGGYED